MSDSNNTKRDQAKASSTSGEDITRGKNTENLESGLEAAFRNTEEFLATLGDETLGLSPLGFGGNYPRNMDQTRLKYIVEDAITAVTDWNSGPREGLLPPLRRADPNQIPPEILAHFAQTGRYNEILNCQPAIPNNTVNSSTQLTGGGNIILDSSMKHWSMPNGIPLTSSSWPSSTLSNALPATPSQQEGVMPSKFRLSPHAAEFIPREQERLNLQNLALAIAEINHQTCETQDLGYVQQQPPGYNPNFNYHPSSSYGEAVQQYPYQDFHYQQRQPQQHQHTRGRGNARRPQHPQARHRGGYRGSRDRGSSHHHSQLETSTDLVLTTITDVMALLISNPAGFDYSVRKAVKIIKEALTDSDTLTVMIDLIVEQSIANKHFSYNGARLCQALQESKIEAAGLTVQSYVMKQVQNVFDSAIRSFDAGPTQSETLRERHIGLLFFLAELFLSFKIENGNNFFGFAVATVEIMQKLIKFETGKSPDYGNVKNVVNILKLAGWDLDHCDHPSLKIQWEQLLQDLETIILADDESFNPSKTLISKIFDLKKCNWGRGEENGPSGTSDSGKVGDEGLPSNTIYEQPLSDDGEFYMDDESEDVNSCYEQFLKELQTSKKKP